jgi:hypothetical protein
MFLINRQCRLRLRFPIFMYYALYMSETFLIYWKTKTEVVCSIYDKLYHIGSHVCNFCCCPVNVIICVTEIDCNELERCVFSSFLIDRYREFFTF